MTAFAEAVAQDEPQPSASAPLVAIMGDDARDILSVSARLQRLGIGFKLVEAPADLCELIRELGTSSDIVVVREPLIRSEIIALLQTCSRIVPHPPVRSIVLVSQPEPDDRKKLIQAGAHYLLENSVDDEALRGVLRAASARSTALEAIQKYVSTHKSAVGKLISGEFEIRTLEEAERLSTMLAANTPCPEKVSTGVWELLSNAIEHGNLEIDFDAKTELLERGQFEAEIVRRLALPAYADRVVRVRFKRTSKAISFHVADGGPGFDHKKFVSADFSDGLPNGRGIRIARQICFDRVTYSSAGNVVGAVIWTPNND